MKQGTSQNLCLLFNRRLRAWKRGNQWRLTWVPLQVRQLQDDQEAIGWENFLFGFVSTKWAEIQQQEYHRQRSKKSGAKWVRLLIPQMWEVIWTQWLHQNTIVHRTNETTGVRNMTSVDNEIQQQVALGLPNRCPVHLRQYFQLTLPQILAKNAFERRVWLHTAQRICTMVTNLLVNHDGLGAERTLMRNWLASAESVPNDSVT